MSIGRIYILSNFYIIIEFSVIIQFVLDIYKKIYKLLILIIYVIRLCLHCMYIFLTNDTLIPDVKKVRKRKTRPFKLGLSRPKHKKEIKMDNLENSPKSNTMNVLDEINASRETIDSISDLHLKRTVKKEITSVIETSIDTDCESVDKHQKTNESILDLVNKISIKHEKVLGAAEVYDFNKQFEPVAGPSRINQVNNSSNKTNYHSSDSYESTPEDGKGIISFYNMSKIFDITLEDNHKKEQMNNSMEICTEMQMDTSILEENNYERVTENVQDQIIKPLQNSNMKQEMDASTIKEIAQEGKEISSKVTNTEQKTNTVIITPKIRPPTKSYIINTLENYKIPKHKNPEPYFSNHKDVGEKVEIGQLVLKLQSQLARDQKPLEKVLNTTSIEEWRQLIFLQSNEMSEEAKPEMLKTLLAGNKHCILQPVKRSPLRSEVIKWLHSNKGTLVNKEEQTEISKNVDDLENSQAIGLNEDEINSSISLEAQDKVKTSLKLFLYTECSYSTGAL